MKRSGFIKRTEPMRAKKGVKRSARINPRNNKRMRERFATAFHSDEFVEWSHMQPSCVSGELPTVCAHGKSRGAGGTFLHIFALTDAEHKDLHNRGNRFWTDRGLDPKTAPARFAAEHYARFLSYQEAYS
jgi:hypothetical protein